MMSPNDFGPTQYMSRVFRHVELFLFTVLLFAFAWVAGMPDAAINRLSTASAWLCFAYMCTALFVGPFFRIRYKKNVVNIYLRRDLGIWTALVGLFHLVVGTMESMNDEYMMRHVDEAMRAPAPMIREMLFSWGSSIGFIVGVIFVGLLAISSDQAIRVLGIKWWKRLQKSSYLAFGLLLVHALAFQVIESRNRVLIAGFMLAGFGILMIRLFAHTVDANKVQDR
jgi:DMSO/TMAO reductase YedYZ heme-binding membrane subunit